MQVPPRTGHGASADGASTMALRGPSSAVPALAGSHASGAMDDVDESSLLAETEELLAALDASAFIASSLASPANDERKLLSGDHLSSLSQGRRPIPAPAPTAGSGDRHENAQPHKKRHASRDTKRDELLQLRHTAAELESQLIVLRQEKGAKTATGLDQKVIAQLWQRVAERQLRVRQLAEADNQQLKAMVSGRLSSAARFAHVPIERPLLPNHAHGPVKQRVCLEGEDALMPNLFEPLVRRLDVEYAEMGAIFHENGIDQSLAESRSYTQSRTRTSSSGTPCRYIELVSVQAVPFEAHAVGELLWQIVKSWHHKDDPYTYPCLDRPENTFAVGYRVESSVLGDSHSMTLKIAMRRYFEQDRVVLVWTARSDGENDLSDMYTKETGWMAIRSAAPPEYVCESPAAFFQVCMHVLPKSKKGNLQPKLADLMASFVLSAFKEDAMFIDQNLENVLLQESRSDGRGHMPDLTAPVPGERITFDEKESRTRFTS